MLVVGQTERIELELSLDYKKEYRSGIKMRLSLSVLLALNIGIAIAAPQNEAKLATKKAVSAETVVSIITIIIITYCDIRYYIRF